MKAQAGNGLLVAASLLVAAAAIELVAGRLAPPRVDFGSATPIHRPHEVLGWWLVPGLDATVTSMGVSYRIHTDAEGLRGPDRDPTRPEARSVVLLGDSFGFGVGVDQDETLTARLETALPDVEIHNLSVSGYSTDQELLAYRLFGRSKRPDLVVVAYCLNDHLGNQLTHRRGVGRGKPSFSLIGDSLGLLGPEPTALSEGTNSSIRRLLSRSATWRVLTDRVGTQLASGRAEEFADREEPMDADSRRDQAVGAELGERDRAERGRITERLIVEIAREAEGDGARTLCFIVPAMKEAGGGDTRRSAPWRSKLQALASAEPSLEYIEIGDAFAEPGAGERLYDAKTLHWNAMGHAACAAVLAPRIAEILGSWRPETGSASSSVGPPSVR